MILNDFVRFFLRNAFVGFFSQNFTERFFMKKLRLHRITSKEDAYLAPFWELYGAAFPEDERRNEEDFLDRLHNDERSHYFAILREEEFIGLIILWKLSEVYYLEHFAIAPECRNGGAGGKILTAVIENGFAPMIGEVEPPEDDTTRRRVDFYRRLGFTLHDIDYLQPPYDENKNALTMNIISFDFEETKLPETLKELKAVVYRCFEA